MDSIRSSGLGRFRFAGAGAAALLLCAALATAGAQVGGAFRSAVGPGKVAVRRSGLPAVPFLANLRFDFDGAPTDATGTGTLFAYDDEGLSVLDEFPFTWTTARGASFRADVKCPELAGFLASLVGTQAGEPVEVVLEKADCKGVLRPSDGGFRAVIQIAGTASLDGGPPLPLRAKMRVK
jgi:hypothetical protein